MVTGKQSRGSARDRKEKTRVRCITQDHHSMICLDTPEMCSRHTPSRFLDKQVDPLKLNYHRIYLFSQTTVYYLVEIQNILYTQESLFVEPINLTNLPDRIQHVQIN